jgi:5-methylcytosine-specific restriction endonuclease McrA
VSRWFRLYDELLDDPKVQRLSAAEFGQQFWAAVNGDSETVFAPYITGPFTRPPAHEWAMIRADIFERDDYTCQYCGAHGVALECDHIVPVVKGGTHGTDNLKTACRACNRSKAAKSIEEWRP